MKPNSPMIDVQQACKATTLPNAEQLESWALSVLKEMNALKKMDDTSGDITIRIVDAAESQALNNHYRGQEKPTNVLSFPFEMPEGLPTDELSIILGDLVICAEVVEREAIEQHKQPAAHWAHIVIHGVLHLLGYDHIDDTDAATMESLEINVLNGLGYANPYIIDEHRLKPPQE